MQLSVIIVSYNVKYFLEQCLYAVEAACKNISAEIFVIDNASPDNTIDYLQPKFGLAKFIKNDLNEGFAKANNKALRLTAGKFILYLNPDTIVAENTFLNCIHFLETNKNASAAGVKLIDGSGNFLPESKRAFPSVAASFFKLSGVGRLFPHSGYFNRYALGNLDENKLHEADVLPGAFLMARKSLLLRLNGFDEDFFMYGEDIDLSYRMQQAGYKNFYLGDNTIIHFKGESTQKGKRAYVKNFYNAMEIFVRKHYKKQSAFLLYISIAFSRLIASIKHSSSIKKEKEELSFLLAGDDEGMASAAKILSAYNLDFQKVNSLDQLSKAIASQTKMAVVFCTGSLSYAETIRFIEKNKNKYAYFWHKQNSQCITGSSYSNAAGEIYASV